MFWNDLEATTVALGVPEALNGRMEKSLPRMGANRIAEQRIVRTPFQPVFPAILFVGPASRQVIAGSETVVDDCPLANSWADEFITLLAQALKQLIQMLTFNDDAAFQFQFVGAHGSITRASVVFVIVLRDAPSSCSSVGNIDDDVIVPDPITSQNRSDRERE